MVPDERLCRGSDSQAEGGQEETEYNADVEKDAVSPEKECRYLESHMQEMNIQGGDEEGHSCLRAH